MKNKIITAKSIPEINDDLTVCIGKFNGFHLGHVGLIEYTKKIAKQSNTKSAIIVFDVPPLNVIKHKRHEILLSNETILEKAKKMGIDYFLIIEFTSLLKNMSAQDFIEKILRQIKVKNVVANENFHFGKNRGGSITLLKKYFNVFLFELIIKNDIGVSSSVIKDLIQDGKIKLANNLLGWNYEIEGTVIHGNHLGRKLGFPTANLHLSYKFCVPAFGVYSGYVWVREKKYKSAISIGNNPTINEQVNTKIEVYIIDFDKDIYDENIRIEFVDFVRKQKKFKSIDDLKTQLGKDSKIIFKYLL